MSGTACLDRLIDRRRADPNFVLQILIDAQAELGWISAATAEHVAGRLGLPRTRIDSLIGFYSFLYDRPVGAYRVLFSDNVTDRMSGSLELYERLRARFRLTRGEVSAEVPGVQGVVVSTLDRSAPELDIALATARPWIRRGRRFISARRPSAGMARR